jgi:2-polyprenyl-6-methoxyphenol hydroxylase-like FAD-dependent oxidoreductase
MSPVGGVGINYAIQDAVVAANVLSGPLAAGMVWGNHLAEVQRQREWPTRLMQAVQTLIQQQVIAGALRSSAPVRLPILARLLLRLPIVRDLPARLIAFGVRPVHVEHSSWA